MYEEKNRNLTNLSTREFRELSTPTSSKTKVSSSLLLEEPKLWIFQEKLHMWSFLTYKYLVDAVK